MGVYLSSPITTKESSDQTYGNFTYGVSSMQGWRMAQEDAHNCIPDFDPNTNTSLFAVYDGHGGAEVAKYCSQNLPNFIKSVELYKEGQLGESLEESFLGFDATLTKDEVIQELKEIAGVDDDEEEEDEDEPTGRTETDMLVAEANMPIEELMAKYSSTEPQTPQIKKLQKEKHCSPMLRAKSDNQTDKARTNDLKSAGSVAAVLEDKLENGQPDNDNNLNVEKELREAKTESPSDIKVKTDKPDIEADNTNNNKSVNSNGVKTDKDQKSEVENSSEVSNEKETVDADSTTDENHVAKSEIVSSSSSGEVSTTSSDSGVQMSSSSTSASSTADADTSGSSSADAKPSGSGCSSSSSAEPSGSGVQAGSSGVSAGSSGTSGSSPKDKKTIADEDFDSDDESSEEDEYMEESDDDDDDEEDEEEEEGSGGFAGVFGGRGVAGQEEEDHNEEPGSDSGCTAVVALLRNKQLVVANAGDSRCVLCREGKAVDLSFDHKPEDEIEKTRIEAAGGKVTNDGRVNGGLNLSRALGDHWYKRNESKAAKDQMISALPDIEEATLTDKDEFMVIACDGIWNFLSSQEVVDFVKERLKDPAKRKKPSLICEEMFDHCLAPNTMGDGTGCDNMTCIIVLFNLSENTETSNKRDTSELDTSVSDEKQPEKRARLEEASTDDVVAT